ncbi:Uncharacterised protein [Streptococcus pneumoniae]|nr:Uncharacterised protein [Streptococcus pneumoniae]
MLVKPVHAFWNISVNHTPILAKALVTSAQRCPNHEPIGVKILTIASHAPWNFSPNQDPTPEKIATIASQMLLNIATTTSQRNFNTPDTRSIMPLKTLTTISFNPPNILKNPSLIFSPSPVKSPVSTSNTPLMISAIPPITSEIVLNKTRQTSLMYSIAGASTTVNFSTIKEMTGPKTSFIALEKSAKLPIMPPIFSKAGSIWFLIVSAKP